MFSEKLIFLNPSLIEPIGGIDVRNCPYIESLVVKMYVTGVVTEEDIHHSGRTVTTIVAYCETHNMCETHRGLEKFIVAHKPRIYQVLELRKTVLHSISGRRLHLFVAETALRKDDEQILAILCVLLSMLS